ncbi:MAG: MIP/aquaporin family protein [Bacteroidia bacterium]|nr:MIP/aquaporin family protein [Bacteroidia bacterium]
MSEFIAEFIGTMILLLLGNGVVANVLLKDTAGNDSGWIVITAGWGMAVFVGVFITMDISGAHLNPAVTLGLAAAGKFAWAKAPSYILAQCLGAATGTTLAWLTYRKHYAITEDQGAKLGTFATAPAIPSTIDNFIAEMVGTFVLVFAVLFATSPELSIGAIDGVAVEGSKIGLGAIGALPVGLLVFAIGLSLGGPTGYAINPARDLMPRIMHTLLPIPGKGSSDWGYSWIPVAGPIAGGLVAAGLFMAIQ